MQPASLQKREKKIRRTDNAIPDSNDKLSSFFRTFAYTILDVTLKPLKNGSEGR